MNKENILLNKSYAFAVRIVKMYKHLSQTEKYFPLFKQVLKSGTSIGANVEEAVGGISRKDFAAKPFFLLLIKKPEKQSIGLNYYYDTDYLSEDAFCSMFNDCEELLKLLYVIIQKSKN